MEDKWQACSGVVEKDTSEHMYAGKNHAARTSVQSNQSLSFLFVLSLNLFLQLYRLILRS